MDKKLSCITCGQDIEENVVSEVDRLILLEAKVANLLKEWVEFKAEQQETGHD